MALALTALALYLALACQQPAGSPAPSVVPTSVASPASVATPRLTTDPVSGLTFVDLDELPPEAATTIALIASRGPFPYSQDGVVFSNREGILPPKSSGYYHEYTVETPGSDDRGARRIVTGADGEMYYTSDHYDSFQRIR
jgi:ribonuclease T1